MLHFGFKDRNVVPWLEIQKKIKKNTYTSETILIIHARFEVGQKEEWGLKLEMEVWKAGSQKCFPVTRQQDRWGFQSDCSFFQTVRI